MSTRRRIAVLLGLALLSAAAAFYALAERTDRVQLLSVDKHFRFRALAISLGRNHEMWAADPLELQFSRVLGRSAWGRRFRFHLLRPITPFRATTREPTLAFILRFNGSISDQELAGLTARLLSGTNVYQLNFQSSSRDPTRDSFIKCWTIGYTPVLSKSVELQILFASGAELARLRLSAEREEFTRPIFAPEKRKSYVAALLRAFLAGQRSAPETLQLVHQFYEEYNGPAFATGLEMLYYESEGMSSPKPPAADMTERLKSEASEWLQANSF